MTATSGTPGDAPRENVERVYGQATCDHGVGDGDYCRNCDARVEVYDAPATPPAPAPDAVTEEDVQRAIRAHADVAAPLLGITEPVTITGAAATAVLEGMRAALAADRAARRLTAERERDAAREALGALLTAADEVDRRTSWVSPRSHVRTTWEAYSALMDARWAAEPMRRAAAARPATEVDRA